MTHDGGGYWEVASDGGIFAFGNAEFFGSMGGKPLNAPIVGMAATPDGGGYWLVASDGGIFSFGDASFYGSTGSIHLNRPIVGMATTPSGKGYWLVASDGGIFSYGDARFSGSMGGRPLNSPVVGMAADAADGRVLGGGRPTAASSPSALPFYGSTGSIRLNAPIVGMEASGNGSGYRFVASDGGHLQLQRAVLRVDGRQAAQQAGRRHGGDLTLGIRCRVGDPRRCLPTIATSRRPGGSASGRPFRAHGHPEVTSWRTSED